MFSKTVLSILLMLLVLGCNKEELERLTTRNKALQEEKADLDKKVAELKKSVQRAGPAQKQLTFLSNKLKGVKARIITNHGNIEVAFFHDKAPIHCFNFITRAESGFYDKTTFHRIIKGFMIQGGDPNSKDNDPNNDGSGGPMVMIPHEFNDTDHKPGILSMARVSNVNAGAGCQFFIVHGNASHLNNQYTAFGKVTKGMEVVNKIAEVKTDRADRPDKPVTIKTIEVYR